MKKHFVLLGTIIILIVVLCENIQNWVAYYNLPQYSTLSESQIIKSVNIIAKKNTNKNANCSISSNINHLISTQEVIEYGSAQIPVQELDDNKKIIFIQGNDIGFNKNLNPNQICGIFDCFLYLEAKNIPFEMYGICWIYTSGGMDNCYSQKTMITKFEFDELYNSVVRTNVDEKQMAKVLAEKWISKTGYEKK